MAEIICNCPHCQQPVTIDDAWAGQQLQCPVCQQPFVAPGAAAPPPPPQRQQQRPSQNIGKGQRFVSSRSVKKDSNAAQKWTIVGLIVIVLGAGGFVLFKYGGKWQKQFTEKANKEAEESGPGGQVGHIGNLYQVLDATDPDKGGLGMGGGSRRILPNDVDAGMRDKAKELPVVPAVWTLDPALAKIPEGRVNGMISGTNFVCDAATLGVAAGTIALNLRQGEGVAADREIVIYLRPKAGEKLGGGSWNIPKEMKTPAAPQVVKRWKSDPRYAPATKSYSTGYVMKLELGPIHQGEVTGKIFISLPDAEKSVVAGIFTAETSLPDTPVAATPPATQ